VSKQGGAKHTAESPDTESRADIIIKGGTLLSMVEGQPPLTQAVVYIQGDKIVHIGSLDQEKILPHAVETINASGALVMPGLINAHCHTAMTLFRGFADDLPLKQWLFEKIFPAEAKHLSPESVYTAALLGSAEMIRSGITTVSDAYYYQDSTIKAFHESGIRAVVAQGVIDFPAPGVPDPSKNLKVGREFIERWIHFSDLITPGLFCHSLVTCSERTLREAMEISQDFSLPLQLHLSETLEEVRGVEKKSGLKPVFYLEKMGLLHDRLVAVHAVHMHEDEIDLLTERDVKVVHAPQSNMKLASGVSKVGYMLRRGLCVGIGTDGAASNNDLDLFQEMDSAAKLSKVSTLDPTSLHAEAVLKMATVWGARALGLEKQIGTIEVGKKADLIIVDTESPHLLPLYSPASALVYSATGSDVRDVIVNGKILLRNRSLLGLDLPRILNDVKLIARKIVGQTAS